MALTTVKPSPAYVEVPRDDASQSLTQIAGGNNLKPVSFQHRLQHIADGSIVVPRVKFGISPSRYPPTIILNVWRVQKLCSFDQPRLVFGFCNSQQKGYAFTPSSLRRVLRPHQHRL